MLHFKNNTLDDGVAWICHEFSNTSSGNNLKYVPKVFEMWRGWWRVVNEIGNLVGPTIGTAQYIHGHGGYMTSQSELITASNIHAQGRYKQSQYWYAVPINLCAIKSLAIRQLRHMRTIVPGKSQRQEIAHLKVSILATLGKQTDELFCFKDSTRILP